MRSAAVLLVGLALSQPARADKPSRTYIKAHALVTEKLVVYEGFHTALLMRATLVGPTFLDALAVARARLLGPALTDPQQLIDDMRLDRGGVFEVVFAADSALPFGEDFTVDDRGWNLVLEADDAVQPLIEIEHVRKPSPMQRALFPQLTIWSEMYVARFERTAANPERVELHVGSGYGHGTITWLRTKRVERKLDRIFRTMLREDDP